MNTRRQFLSLVSLLILPSRKIFALVDKNLNLFDNIIYKSHVQNWKNLPINQLVGKIGLELISLPYIGGTLDTGQEEKCIVTFTGFDCVTFFEVSLCFARIVKKGKFSFEDLIDEVTYTRYRNGKIIDYTSRLHYTSDWIFDNIQKKVVRDKTKELGADKLHFNVSFMSRNPEKYQGLILHPELLPKIERIEREINKRIYYFIPKDRVQNIENFLLTGDIIGIATQLEGLDYSHTGIIINTDGKARFLHASSKKKKVVLDTTISNYLKQNNNSIGITVLEPLEP